MAKMNGTSKKAMTKSEIMETLATEANLTKKEVARTLEGLTKLIEKNIGKRGPGVFKVPGLLKVMVVRKPATAARKGINPFTGLETTFKAKPAQHGQVGPLKALK